MLWVTTTDPEAGPSGGIEVTLRLSLRWPVECAEKSQDIGHENRDRNCSLTIFTVGPKRQHPFPLQTVSLTPGVSTITVPVLSLVQNGLAFGCISNGAASDNHEEEQGLRDAKFSREDVLVPRGTNDTRRPSGMGHWDSFTSTLYVGVEPTLPATRTPLLGSSGTAATATTTAAGPVAIAGVILRDVPAFRNYSLCAAVKLHAAVDSSGNAANPLEVALRLDYLDGERTLQSLSYGTQNVAYPDFWVQGAASVCMYTRATLTLLMIHALGFAFHSADFTA